MHKEKLVKEIVTYMNELNENMFIEEELKEFTNDYMYMIENERDSFINVLKDEYANSKDIKVLEFIKELEMQGDF